MKTFLWTKLPGLYSVLQRAKHAAESKYGIARRSRKAIFTEMWRDNAWKDEESRSGSGSNLINTAAIRRALPELIQRRNVRSMLDAPCGDFCWMSQIDLPGVRYHGADIVDALIEDNIRLYSDENRSFHLLDVTGDSLPAVDLILCRDCLVHLSFRDIRLALSNFEKSGSRYLVTTTFPDTEKNRDICTGYWRPLNLRLAPFHFPPPLELISEEYVGTRGGYPDKSLGLWEITGLP